MSLKSNGVKITQTNNRYSMPSSNSNIKSNKLLNQDKLDEFRFQTQKVIQINGSNKILNQKENINFDKDDPEYLKEKQRPAVIKVIFMHII